MEEALVHAGRDISDDEADSVLIREDLDTGCRWTLPSDGMAIIRASRIVSIFAGLLFVGGAVVLFCTPVFDRDTIVRALTTAWIVSIILALAAAHWRAIAGEPLVLEVTPDEIQLHNPAYLWQRTRRWPIRRVSKLVLLHRGKSIVTGRPVGNLNLRTKLRSCTIFHGLEIAELHEVADRIHGITGIPLVK